MFKFLKCLLYGRRGGEVEEKEEEDRDMKRRRRRRRRKQEQVKANNIGNKSSEKNEQIKALEVLLAYGISCPNPTNDLQHFCVKIMMHETNMNADNALASPAPLVRPGEECVRTG